MAERCARPERRAPFRSPIHDPYDLDALTIEMEHFSLPRHGDLGKANSQIFPRG